MQCDCDCEEKEGRKEGKEGVVITTPVLRGKLCTGFQWITFIGDLNKILPTKAN